MQSLFEKLQLKDEKNLLIQGLPSSIEKQFVKLYYSKNVTPLLKSKKIDFALVFALSVQQMCNILKEVLPALHAKSKLWVAFPRATSKIVSDLNRDYDWDMLCKQGYAEVDQIDLDHVWSGIRFKKTSPQPAATPVFAELKPAKMKGVDFGKKLVAPPKELESYFIKHSKARDFFTSLSVTNQEEYVCWIEGAKKAETKQRRLEVALEKLLAGKMTPLEK